MNMSNEEMKAFFATSRLIHLGGFIGTKQVEDLLELYTGHQLLLALQIMESQEGNSLRVKERIEILKELI
tara:strand:- start:165 stop:374 length:210 start_codon:yes stop_codon:yes gene_type:complete